MNEQPPSKRRYRLPRFRRHQPPHDGRSLATSVVPASSDAGANEDHSLTNAGGEPPHVVFQPYHLAPPRVVHHDLFHGEEHADLSEAPYVPEPADFLPSPPKPPGPLDAKPRPTDLRPALFCFLLFWVISLHDWTEARSDGLWASGDRVFAHREYWRLLSALFAHADIGHLLSNTPLFVIFGWYLYAFFGPWVFPGAALLIGVLSNLATIYAYPPGGHLLGASGMVYGMAALWLVLYVRFETNLRVSLRFMRALAVSLILLFPTTFEPTTSYMAHAAGFGIGLLLGFAMLPFVKVATWRT